MMYFLDFDRTVFDTDTFYLSLKDHPVLAPLHAQASEDRAQFVRDAVALESFSFAPGELSRFVYEDAARFLRDKENGVMLITFGNPAFQKAKVESAIHGIPRISTMYTGDVRKGTYIAPHIGLYGQAPVFVDDAPLELEILAAHAPGAQLYEIRRDGMPGDGRWPVIRSLSELP